MGSGVSDGEAGIPHPLPGRYSIVEVHDGRALVCEDAIAVLLHVERGLTVDESRRGDYPPQTIFLDGVFDGPPFYDNSARHYSLDHHVGCVRAFTLATCEQAVVMLLQGLPLDEGTWNIYANTPDMDTLLAAWLLLNHRPVLDNDARLLESIMPLVRVEGVIDAHGLDMAVLTALPELVYKEQKQTIERLMERERELRATGRWEWLDRLAYSRDMLESLDRLLLPAGRSVPGREVEVVAVRSIGAERVAVLCRSQQGIYEVELVLKERHGRSLGLIVLDRGQGSFTLRQTDPFMERTLDDVYPALNEEDVLVATADAHDDHWGGSSDIGGSPRKRGSGLDAKRVFDIARRTLAARTSSSSSSPPGS